LNPPRSEETGIHATSASDFLPNSTIWSAISG